MNVRFFKSPGLPIELIPSGNWHRASEDFFDSFRNYDEAGSSQRIQVLKYLVLANMLTGSEVNPFDSQETKPWVLEDLGLRPAYLRFS